MLMQKIRLYEYICTVHIRHYVNLVMKKMINYTNYCCTINENESILKARLRKS